MTETQSLEVLRELGVRCIFIRHQWFFNPLEIVRRKLSGEDRSVLDIESHVIKDRSRTFRPSTNSER